MIIKRKQYVEALLWHTLVAFVAPVVHVVSVVVKRKTTLHEILCLVSRVYGSRKSAGP